MVSVLETYEKIISEQPVLNDAGFLDLLLKAQAGDEAALRQISGSYLRVAFDWAIQRKTQCTQDELLEVIQDANATMVAAISTFSGSSSE